MNKLLLCLTILTVACVGHAQLDGNIPVPPKKQNTYYFTIEQYNRQPTPPKYIRDEIDRITKKPKSKWSQKDSLFYAYEKVHLEEFGFALSIFSRVEMDTVSETHAQQLYRTSLLMTKRYEELLAYNEITIPEDSTSLFSVKDAILSVSQALVSFSSKKEKRDTIFPYLYSEKMDELKSSRRSYRTDMVSIAKNVDTALRYFTFLNDSRNAVLSRAFEEYGDFQKKYFYISNAYLCYAIARHYNRNDKTLSEKYNRAIDEIADRNYLLPSFRTKFGKVLDNRYELNEELTELKKDTIDPKLNFKPPSIPPKKDYLPWLDVPTIIMIGLFLMLVIVLIFVRSDRKKND
tara:strand:- start:43145 stop:44185 length:1041 start_codon:yes stop_codon:yes gene_type:complete